VSVGKISAACWIFFAIMSVAFLPLAFGIASVHALPAGARIGLAIVVVGVLWWGPFVYAMYLSQAVMRNGDKRLLKRGIAGTAEVLSAKRTNTVIQQGGFAWEAPRLYKYRLRVSIPGKAPYETDCAICASGVSEGSVVNVAVSRHNKHRVTIDVGQGSKGGARVPSLAPGNGAVVDDILASAGSRTYGSARQGWTADEAQRIGMLAQLGQLHRQGVLTDDEFTAQKAQLLAE
jgi:hypothetical protein